MGITCKEGIVEVEVDNTSSLLPSFHYSHNQLSLSHTHTRTHAHARTHTHTHTSTQTHAHTETHTHAHTHTHKLHHSHFEVIMRESSSLIDKMSWEIADLLKSNISSSPKN